MTNVDVVVFLSLIVIIFVCLFVGLGLPIAKEERRIRKAQAEARKYLREIEEGRTDATFDTEKTGYKVVAFYRVHDSYEMIIERVESE